MRDEQFGIYCLKFDSTLNPNLHQIESELQFTTSPENSQKLIEKSEYILQNLAQMITEQDVENARKIIIQQEREHLQNPETWLKHLILSHQQYIDGRYLQQVPHLTKHINLLEHVEHY